MRRAALLLLVLLAGCQRAAFDNPEDEAFHNAPLPPGLAVKHIGPDAPPLAFMGDATVVSDPGSGGPTRAVEVRLSEGPNKGDVAPAPRHDLVPADTDAWRASHGLPAKAD